MTVVPCLTVGTRLVYCIHNAEPSHADSYLLLCKCAQTNQEGKAILAVLPSFLSFHEITTKKTAIWSKQYKKHFVLQVSRFDMFWQPFHSFLSTYIFRACSTWNCILDLTWVRWVRTRQNVRQVLQRNGLHGLPCTSYVSNQLKPLLKPRKHNFGLEWVSRSNVKESVQINYRGDEHFFRGWQIWCSPNIQENVQPRWIIVPVMNATLIPTAARVKQGAGGGRRKSGGPKAKAKMESDGVTWRRQRR